MFWQEKDPDKPYVVPDDIVDMAFRIDCPTLPLDHAWALSQAVLKALPWLEEEPDAALHLVHGAESGNGWYRPEDPENELLHLSKRTRMTLRLPKERIADAEKLAGQILDVDGYPLKAGKSAIKKLTDLDTVFSRYVVCDDEDDEDIFLRQCAGECAKLGIAIQKALCGKINVHKTPEGNIYTRKLMLAEVPREQSVLLQQKGIGPGRKMGLGIFLGHKGIAAVKEKAE